ncbi:hypothetical protein ACVWW6_006063 [Bradyrhizobium sp. USDA 3311]
MSDERPWQLGTIFKLRIAEAQLAMRLSQCPPPGAEQLRNAQLMIRECVRRMSEMPAS